MLGVSGVDSVSRIVVGWATMRSVADATVPSYFDLLWPTLQAVVGIDGSGRLDEINRAVVEREGFNEEQQAVLHGDGPQTEIEYRLAWARTYLKGMGLLANSGRGVWSVTEIGRNVRQDELSELHAAYARQARERSRQRQREEPAATDHDATDDVTSEDDWKQGLLDVLVKVAPDRFERLARRVLREAGFINTAVTGKSGDGGIDGIGTYRMSLISFTVFFQCKRYAGSVGAGAVRDFRGAMTGRGDKGLLITTGTFTADAQREATRDGAPPIDLIDGEALCELLRQYELGVETTLRQVEEIELRPEFFDEI
jgi:restriction system protein